MVGTSKKREQSELSEAWAEGRQLLRAVFLFSIFVNLLMLTGPLFMLQVYDRVLGSGSEATLLALFLLIIGLYAMMAILDFVRGRVLARFGAQFQSKLDPRVFEASLNEAADPEARAKPASGLRDLETLQQLFTSPALLAICDAPWVPFFVVLIFVFHPMLGWLALAGGGLLIALTLLNHKRSRQQVLEGQSRSASAAGFAETARLEAGFIQAQGMGGSILQRWLGLRAAGVERTLSANDITGFFSAFTKAFRMFLQSAMLAMGAYLVLQGQLTAGAMIAGSILLGRALAPIEQSIGSWPLVQKSMAGWKNLNELLDAVPAEKERVELPRPDARLELRKVTTTVPDRKMPILNQIDFKIAPGEAVGVIGKSGAGKSSLGRVILGMSIPQAGEALLGGAHLSQYSATTLGSAIGYLPQQVSLFPASIAENIARMAQDPDHEAIIDAAKRAHVHELITSLPKGYETLLGHGDNVLSGGQVQRLGLARALYSDPVLLVLDEPNSALDADGTEALNQCIRDFKSDGKAVILMTHRPMAITECDRLVVIEQGNIRADGPRDQVLGAMVKNSGQVKKLVTEKS